MGLPSDEDDDEEPYPPEFPLINRPRPVVVIPPRPRAPTIRAPAASPAPTPVTPPSRPSVPPSEILPSAEEPLFLPGTPDRPISPPWEPSSLLPAFSPLPLHPPPVVIRRPRNLDLLDVAAEPPCEPQTELEMWLVARLAATTDFLFQMADRARDLGYAEQFGIADYPDNTLDPARSASPAPDFVEGSSSGPAPHPAPDSDDAVAELLAAELDSPTLPPLSPTDEDMLDLTGASKGKGRET